MRYRDGCVSASGPGNTSRYTVSATGIVWPNPRTRPGFVAYPAATTSRAKALPTIDTAHSRRHSLGCHNSIDRLHSSRPESYSTDNRDNRQRAALMLSRRIAFLTRHALLNRNENGRHLEDLPIADC